VNGLACYGGSESACEEITAAYVEAFYTDPDRGFDKADNDFPETVITDACGTDYTCHEADAPLGSS
jgi:hypothetical protein